MHVLGNIKYGSVPRAVPGITVGHEMVGIVETIGEAVTTIKPGDRVTVNVETFCGEGFFCKNGYVNNCTDENGDTTPLITHRFSLNEIEKAYDIFEKRLDGVMKIAIINE